MNASTSHPCQTLSDLATIEKIIFNEGSNHHPIRLHCNETPFDLPEELKQQLATQMAELAWNRYPDFHNTELTALIADHAGVLPQNVILGNGSSQLIQQIFSCCAKFLSVAVIEQPTFTFYHQVCQNERMAYQEWPLAQDGTYDLSTFPSVSEPALVALTSPNNPMGSVFPQALLEVLLEKHPQHIFIMDEAYAEFGNETAVSLIKKYTNLLVLKTFSKGYGLPSVRFGYVVGNAKLVKLLNKHTVPFTINIFTELVVRELLTNPAIANALHTNRERIKNLRDFVCYQLQDMANDGHFTVQSSAANFLLLRFEDEALLQQLKDTLAANRILVSYPIHNCLRLTIGTEVEMSRVLRVLKRCLVEYHHAEDLVSVW